MKGAFLSIDISLASSSRIPFSSSFGFKQRA